VTLFLGELVTSREESSHEANWKYCELGFVVDRYYRVSLPYVKVLTKGKFIEYPERHLRRIDETDGKNPGGLLQG